MEIWKDIQGYEGLYQVSSLGNVRSLDREMPMKNGVLRKYKGKMMKIQKQTNGYHQVCLGFGNNQIVHRLVAKAFIPNPENKSDVNHKDGDKNNNSVDNLEWTTRSENTLHGYENDLLKKGANRYNSKLTEEEVIFILRNFKSGDKEFGCNALAKKFNVSRRAIQQVYNRERWKHIQVYRSTTIENTSKDGSE